MYQLCAGIETEKDPGKFLELIQELNDLLSQKTRRLGEVTTHRVTALEPAQSEPKGPGQRSSTDEP